MTKRRMVRTDGQPLLPARGRDAPIENFDSPLLPVHAVLDLRAEDPECKYFLEVVKRELCLRFYRRSTIKAYLRSVSAFLYWTGRRPKDVCEEDLREYLYCLIQEGAGASTVSGHLAGIRTAFDKLCAHGLTLGLIHPRKPTRKPVMLSQQEVLVLLGSAPRLGDKLMLALMYASGLRVSEVVRLRWEEIDLVQFMLRVVDGKGRKDRYVVLPQVLKPLLLRLKTMQNGRGWLFPSSDGVRPISPRTAQRAMKHALKLSGLEKRVTCHSLRHAYATHLLESGTDVRVIQRLLGHARLETTALYTQVARPTKATVESPLDGLEPSFAAFRVELRLQGNEAQGRLYGPGEARLDGLEIGEHRPGWCWLNVPPFELWEPFLRQISVVQRRQVQSSAFFDWLRETATKEFRLLVDARLLTGRVGGF